ncbi:hypothetical protein YC2023_016941 [Brassica napus]
MLLKNFVASTEGKVTSTPVYYQSSFPLSFTEKKKCITLRWLIKKFTSGDTICIGPEDRLISS